MIKECCGYMKSFGVRYLVSVVVIFLVDIADSQSFYSAAYQPLATGFNYGGYVDPSSLQKVNNGIYSFSNNYTLPTAAPLKPQWYATTAPQKVKPEKSKWYAPSGYEDPYDVPAIEPSDIDVKDEWGFLEPPPLVNPPIPSTNNRFISKKMAKIMMTGVKMTLVALVALGLPTIIAFHILVLVKLALGFKVVALSSAFTVGLLVAKYYLHHKHKLQTYLTAIETIQTVADVATASGLPFWGPALISSGASTAVGLTGAAALFAALFRNSTNSTTTTTTAAPEVVVNARNRIQLLHLPLPEENEPIQQMKAEVLEEFESPKPSGIISAAGKIIKTTKDFLTRWRKYLIIS